VVRRTSHIRHGIIAPMGHRLLRADDAFWRRSNQMKTPNTDLGK
jgi:hypothetical protein